MNEMPMKSREWLTSECVKAVQRDGSTRGTTAIEIVRLRPKGGGPNWKIGKIFPPVSELGRQDAIARCSELWGTYALADED